MSGKLATKIPTQGWQYIRPHGASHSCEAQLAAQGPAQTADTISPVYNVRLQHGVGRTKAGSLNETAFQWRCRFGQTGCCPMFDASGNQCMRQGNVGETVL